jgi:hypothetical protein
MTIVQINQALATLRADDVIAAALRAIDEGRLQLQHPDTGTSCHYCQTVDATPVVCAVGAALPPDVSHILENAMIRDGDDGELAYLETGIDSLFAYGIIQADDPDLIIAIQSRHDGLVQSEDLTVQQKVKQFRRYLNDVSRTRATKEPQLA